MERTISWYADSADLGQLDWMVTAGKCVGITTNPTLLRKASIDDIAAFGQTLAQRFPGIPISIPVTAKDPEGIRRQALALAALADTIVVKIPVITPSGVLLTDLARHLAGDAIPLNITGVVTREQIEAVCDAVPGSSIIYVSILAGRIADCGVDPEPLVQLATSRIADAGAGVIWASTRELWNIVQAARCRCTAVTLTPELLGRIDRLTMSLDIAARETVAQFAFDADAAGYS